MSTESAHWSKWPSRWLKSLPNVDLEEEVGADSELKTGAPSRMRERALEAFTEAPAPLLRFEDFVERPLRSSSRQHEERCGGRNDEAAGGGSSPDGGDGAGSQP